MHFDYCTTASTEFVLLDEATFREILLVSCITSLFNLSLEIESYVVPFIVDVTDHHRFLLFYWAYDHL